MVFELYAADYPLRHHEGKQINKLLREFHRWFSDSPAKCIAIIGLKIPNAQIDLLLLKDNRIIVVELKNYSGKIIADCASEGKLWSALANSALVPLGTVNPYFQAKRERIYLAKFLRRIKSRETGSVRIGAGPEFDPVFDEIISNISAWVVLNDDATWEISGVSTGANPWFDVLRISDVPMELNSEYNAKTLLEPRELSNFLKNIGAELRDWNRWRTPEMIRSIESEDGGSSDEPPTSPGIFGIPRIDFLFDSLNDENVLLALKYVQELNLTGYSNRVLEQLGSKNGEVRRKVLSVLMEWDFKGLGSILAGALEDSDPEIVSFVLAYLEHRSYPETLPALNRIIEAGPSPYLYSALKALESSPSEQACRLILRLFTYRLGSYPFKEFRQLDNLRENARPIYKTYKEPDQQTDSERQVLAEYELASKKYEDLLALSKAVITALGNLKCSGAVPALIDILSSPRHIGMEKDGGTGEPYSKDGYGLLSAWAVQALGKIGDPRATDVLLNRLASNDEENKHLIILSLGDLGDKKAARTLVGLLNSPDEWIRDHSILSLGKLQDEATFDEVAKIYLKNFEREGDLHHRAENALIQISKVRFEELLLGLISSKVESGEPAEQHLRALGRMATERSIPILFDFLSGEQTYEMAADILSYRLGDRTDVTNQALALVRSKNAIACAGAILVLWSNPKVTLPDLSEFEAHTAWQVRKAVCTIYGIRADSASALKLANDPDSRVRREAGFCFRRGPARTYPNCVVATEVETLNGRTSLTPEAIITEIGDRFFILKLSEIVRVGFFANEGEEVGVYVKYREPENVSQLMIVPLVRIRRGAGHWCRDISESVQRTTNRYLGELVLTPSEQAAAEGLWNRVLEFLPYYKESDKEDN